MRKHGSEAMWLLARRLVVRDAKRSLLVVALVALPVAALVSAVIVVATVTPTADEAVTERLGHADLEVLGASSDLRSAELQQVLPEGSVVLEGWRVFTQNIVSGVSVYLPIQEFSEPVGSVGLEGRFALLAGQAPRRAGELGLNTAVMELLDLKIGDDLVLDDMGLSLHVTGVIAEWAQPDEATAVVGTGSLPESLRSADHSFWVDLPEGTGVDEVAVELRRDDRIGQVNTRYELRLLGDQGEARSGGAFAIGVLGLVAASAVIRAAFTVSTQRRLRLLGLIGAQGGERRQQRALLLAHALFLGLLGSLVGAVAGLLLSWLLFPLMDDFVGKPVGPLVVPWFFLLLALTVGTAVVVLAALRPVRVATRLAINSQLAGGERSSRKPGRFAALGVLLIVAGSAWIGLGTIVRVAESFAVGTTAIAIGVLMSLPLLVSWVGRASARLPTIPRIAGRELGRNGHRTGAALAAAALAMALPIAVATSTLSEEAAERRTPFMDSDQLSVTVSADARHLKELVSRSQADLRRAFPDSLVVRLMTAGLAPTRGADRTIVFVDAGSFQGSDGSEIRRFAPLWIGSASLLRAFHAQDAAQHLASGRVVAVGPDSFDGATVRIVADRGGDTRLIARLDAVTGGETRYASLSNQGEFNYVIAPDLAQELGLSPDPERTIAQLILRSPTPLTDQQIQSAREVAARYHGISVLSGDDLGSDAGSARRVATVAGFVLALAVVSVVLALLAAEARRDRAILETIGAGPWTRRLLGAASGWMVASLAAVVGVVIGVVPVVFRALSEYGVDTLVVPWVTLVTACLSVPIVAAVLSALVTSRSNLERHLRPDT